MSTFLEFRLYMQTCFSSYTASQQTFQAPVVYLQSCHMSSSGHFSHCLRMQFTFASLIVVLVWQVAGCWFDSSLRHLSPLGLHQKMHLPNQTCGAPCSEGATESCCFFIGCYYNSLHFNDIPKIETIFSRSWVHTWKTLKIYFKKLYLVSTCIYSIVVCRQAVKKAI